MVLLHKTLRKYIFHATDTQFMPERIFEMSKKSKVTQNELNCTRCTKNNGQ